MGGRIDDLEKSIGDLMEQVGLLAASLPEKRTLQAQNLVKFALAKTKGSSDDAPALVLPLLHIPLARCKAGVDAPTPAPPPTAP